MENDPTRRRLLPPRPPSATNLSSHRRSLLPPLHNLEGLGKLNSSSDSSQNVAENYVRSSADRIDVSPSADSFTEKLNSGSKEKLPLPSPGAGAAALFEYANGKFSEARMKKIMADKHLAELMLTDPTRIKRLLSNRKYAAKAKDRNKRHISELELRFQMLKMEASTLSARLKWLQTKSAELTKQNNELKIRLQFAEKVARVKEGLHETLCAEVQILKRLTTD